MKRMCRDLVAEHEALDAVVRNLDDAGWKTVTPFYGWTVQDEIGHIAYYDIKSLLAITDARGFAAHCEELLKNFVDYDKTVADTLKDSRKMAPGELLSMWRKERTAMVQALERLDPRDRLPWYGPPMSARSFATARLMETWAHGQDIVDAVHGRREPTDRLRHIAHLGIATFGWSFMNRQMAVPEKKVRVELTSPSGELWTWGEPDLADTVRGQALDFCLVVTQRRNVRDTGLGVKGPVAEEWMRIAQAFAGPSENGPPPGKFK